MRFMPWNKTMSPRLFRLAKIALFGHKFWCNKHHFDKLTMPTKKRVAPTLVGPLDNGDDDSVHLTARQIAVEEAKAVKKQEEFQAKRRAEEKSKEKEQAKREKQQQLKRKRDDEDESSPPPPQEIAVKRKTQLIRGRTKRQENVAAKDEEKEEPIYDSENSECYNTANMIKKILKEQEEEEAKAGNVNGDNKSLCNAAAALAAMKSTDEAKIVGDVQDDEMSTSKSSQSAGEEASIASESTCTGVDPDEDDDATEWEDGGDEESGDDDVSFDLGMIYKAKKKLDDDELIDDMIDDKIDEQEDYAVADDKTMEQVFSQKYTKSDEHALQCAILAAERVARLEQSIETDQKEKGITLPSEMNDDKVIEAGGFVLGDLTAVEFGRHVTEAMKERNLILEEAAALKCWDSYYRHPTHPLHVDPTLMGRNYFCRASAPMPAADSDPDDDDKKPAAKPVVHIEGAPDVLWLDSDEESAVVVKQEPKQEVAPALAKKGRGNRKRAVGTAPETILQQNDANTRLKLDAVMKPMETLQKMTIPLSRTDNGEECPEEAEWPWVIHGCFCYTEQEPNEDGQKSAPGRLARPQLHLWGGSAPSKEHLEGQLAAANGIDIVVHSNFESYKNAFRSDSARAKPAPPPGDKSTSIDFLKFA